MNDIFELMNNSSVVTGAAGAGSAGAVALYFTKRWFKSVDHKLDLLLGKVHTLEVQNARYDERHGNAKEDVETIKKDITKLEGKVDKAWDVISRIAQPRISDMLSRESKE